jgi:hypothetical protein
MDPDDLARKVRAILDAAGNAARSQ